MGASRERSEPSQGDQGVGTPFLAHGGDQGDGSPFPARGVGGRDPLRLGLLKGLVPLATGGLWPGV